jgi:DNA-binding transcriptional regulator YdaS (Cro superfamily)
MEKLLDYLNSQRGRRKELAGQLGIQCAALSQWKQVPPARVMAVHEITQIPLHELRPDLYQAPNVGS